MLGLMELYYIDGLIKHSMDVVLQRRRDLAASSQVGLTRLQNTRPIFMFMLTGKPSGHTRFSTCSSFPEHNRSS
jgi:hypothetical protein